MLTVTFDFFIYRFSFQSGVKNKGFYLKNHFDLKIISEFDLSQNYYDWKMIHCSA